MIKRRCVLVGGADIKFYERILPSLHGDDYYVFCDCGLRHMSGLGVQPDLIVGDFDSFLGTRPDVETIMLPCRKDDTDSFFAAKEAIARGFSDFLLLGVFGGRLDHTIGNLSLLMFLDTNGMTAQAISDDALIQVVSRHSVTVDNKFPYFSVFSLNPRAEGVWIRGAEYPLENAELTSEFPLGISNRVLPNKHTEISVEKGRLLLIMGYDPLP